MKNLIKDPAYAKIRKKLENRIEEYKKETDLSPKEDLKIAESYFLGPFDNSQEKEVVENALNISMLGGTAFKAGNKSFSWKKIEKNEVASLNS